jgi:hypothetical protein
VAGERHKRGFLKLAIGLPMLVVFAAVALPSPTVVHLDSALALSDSTLAPTFKPDLWAVSNIGAAEYDRQGFGITLGNDDLAVAKTTVYVAPGDAVSLPGGSVGEQIGIGAASLKPLASTSAPIPMFGKVLVADPALYLSNACSPGNHRAVWLLVLNAASGQRLWLPMYVDTGSLPFTGLGSYQVTVCLPSPYLPPNQGGAPFGAKLLGIGLWLENFRHVEPGRWTALVTPYLEGTGTPNRSATAETQSLVGAARITNLKAKRVVKGPKNHRRYSAKISGVVREYGHRTRARTVLFVGHGTLTSVDDVRWIVVAHKKTTTSGRFIFRARLGPDYPVIGPRNKFLVEARNLRRPDHLVPPQCVPELELSSGPLPCTSVSSPNFDTYKVSRKIKLPKK